MKFSSIAVLATAAAVATALVLPVANAKPTFLQSLPNGQTFATTPIETSLCTDGSGKCVCGPLGHETCMPGSRGPFGMDFAKAGKKWTKELCQMDSDNDGLTNGEELGDPLCTWTAGQAPLRTDQLSHPGDAKSINAAPKAKDLGTGTGGASNDTSSDTTTATTAAATTAPAKSAATSSTTLASIAAVTVAAVAIRLA